MWLKTSELDWASGLAMTAPFEKIESILFLFKVKKLMVYPMVII
jgi:hypothetical protein